MDLKVDTERMTTLAANATAAGSEIIAALDSLAGSAHDLRGRWRGDAQAAFTSRWSAADAQWRAHAASLHRSGRRLERLAEEYRRADADGARAVLGRG